MKRHPDAFLLIFFLVSLLTFSLAEYWDDRQAEAHLRSNLSDWEDKAGGLAQQFRNRCSADLILQDSFARAKSSLAGMQAPFGNNGELVVSTLSANFPEGWFGSDTKYYVFRFNGNRGKSLSGRGLERKMGTFLARNFAMMFDWSNIADDEKKLINSRLASFFGPFIDAELLLKNRAGKPIKILFNNEPQNLYWDFLDFGARGTGAVLKISRFIPAGQEAIKQAMNEIASFNDGIFPVMMPIKTLANELTPVILSQHNTSKLVIDSVAALTAADNYAEIASFSVANLLPQSLALRSAVSRHIPYELWLFAENVSATFSSRLPVALALLVFWSMIAAIRYKKGKFYFFTVRARLLGLIIALGGLPLTALILTGQSGIEEGHYNRFRGIVNELRNQLREIDGNSTSIRINFENISRRFLNDSDFKQAAIRDKADATDSRIKECFEDFAAIGIPLNGIGVINFGEPARVIVAPDDDSRRSIEWMSFFTPMLYSSLNWLSESDYMSALSRLSESSANSLKLHQSIAGSMTEGDIPIMRQQSIKLKFGADDIFVIFDFIADKNGISAALVFFSDAFSAYLQHARQAIARSDNADKHRQWAFAYRTSAGTNIVRPTYREPDDHEDWFVNILSRSFANSSTIIEESGNTLGVFIPLEHMAGITMGTTTSIKRLDKTTADHYHLLLLAAFALAIVIIAVAAAITKFFLSPLDFVEQGLENILQQNFDFRLNLNRDDELGDVANAFDNMTVRLGERYELARFVSGTLSSRLESNEVSPRGFEHKWGVVLASDIRSFTTLSETWPPESIVKLLNRHLELMSTQVINHKGEIDKFIGDAIVAVFFGETRENAARNAIAAAIEMMNEHKKFVAERLENGEFGYSMGIGIACSDLLSGEFGSVDRREYSLIGEARHMSETLEAESKAGKHSHIVVSSEILKLVPSLTTAALKDSSNFEVITR